MHHGPRLRPLPPSSAALPIAIPGSIWCSFTAAYGVCDATGTSSLSSCGSTFVLVFVYRVSHFTHMYHISIPIYPISRAASFSLGFDSLRFGICLLYRQSERASLRREMVFFFALFCALNAIVHPPNRFPLLMLLLLHRQVLILISSL
jgi:uncharacterized membrane protein